MQRVESESQDRVQKIYDLLTRYDGEVIEGDYIKIDPAILYDFIELEKEYKEVNNKILEVKAMLDLLSKKI